MARLGVDRAGWPFIGVALAVAVALGVVMTWAAALPFLVLAAFFTFFFRDPERVPPTGRDLVLSPADGRILVAGPANPAAAPPGQWQQISIFLSPMDVHVNRMPVSGRVTSVTFLPGRFLPAYRHEAATANERSEVFIDHGGQTVVARQIVGFLARRVVCRAKVGAEVAAGERFGVMKFGSRMDVFLPLKASIRITVGQVVRGGETVIAVLD
jgi:phosphatidylserine decarboxylase